MTPRDFVCAAHSSPAGVRDVSILALLSGAGLRRAEAVRRDVDHVDSATGALTCPRQGPQAPARLARGAAAKVLRAWGA